MTRVGAPLVTGLLHSNNLRNRRTARELVEWLFGAFVLLAPSSPAAVGQTGPPAQESLRLEITLERKVEDEWRIADPGLVLEQNDEVRFRLTGTLDGYLYVMNLNTSGQYVLLFPREDTGQANRIQAHREYLVPPTEGWFRITGPPGYEIVYWLVSPVDLQNETIDSKPAFVPLPPPESGRDPSKLLPRCDDSIFKARGDCIDTSAGPKGIGEAEKLPDNLTGIAGVASRELAFSRLEHSTVVLSPTSLKGPVIFEFRLAHR
jgi:Domain of unknown function (DUF4384)